MTKALEAGDPAPRFILPASSGRSVRLSDYSAQHLILFFYPKDDTEACTKEAVAFSDMQSRVNRKGCAILGVSRDLLESHAKFIAKHKLKIQLASDVDGKACEAFGVWGEKQLYGRKFMGIIRSTFLIDPRGVILRVWRKVRVPGHAEAVYQALTSVR